MREHQTRSALLPNAEGAITRHDYQGAKPVVMTDEHGQPFDANALIYRCRITGTDRVWGFTA